MAQWLARTIKAARTSMSAERGRSSKRGVDNVDLAQATGGGLFLLVQLPVRDIPPPRTMTPTSSISSPRMDIAPGGGYEGAIVVMLGLVVVAILVMVIRARRR